MTEKIPDIETFPVKMNVNDESVTISFNINNLHNSSTRDPALIGLAEGLPKLLK
jgi:hypothetical protein